MNQRKMFLVLRGMKSKSDVSILEYSSLGIILSYIIIMSHYTFTLLPQVYKWMVADQLFENKGISIVIKARQMKKGQFHFHINLIHPCKTGGLSPAPSKSCSLRQHSLPRLISPASSIKIAKQSKQLTGTLYGIFQIIKVMLLRLTDAV